MNTLLLFFALPISTIILASAFVNVLKSPITVAATSFAIYLIVTFAVFDETFLIATIVYTVLAFASAVISKIIFKLIENQNNKVNSEYESGEKTIDSIDNIDNMLNLRTNNIYRCNRK